jgi:hypothetical protein
VEQEAWSGEPARRQEAKRGAGGVERGASKVTGDRGQEPDEHSREEAQEARVTGGGKPARGQGTGDRNQTSTAAKNRSPAHAGRR